MKKIAMIGCLVALHGCTAYHYNSRPITPPDEKIKKFATVSVVSPKEYDHYNLLFDQYSVFPKVATGYADSELEIHIQRSSEPVNTGVTFISLMVSAFTLFVVPAVSNFEERIDFTTYYKGVQVDNREYVANKQMILWLFNPPSAQDPVMEIDKQFVGRYLTDFSQEESLRKLGTK
jgi:hypothetical protein